MRSCRTVCGFSVDEIFGFRPFSDVSLNGTWHMERFKDSVMIFPLNDASIFEFVINCV